MASVFLTGICWHCSHFASSWGALFYEGFSQTWHYSILKHVRALLVYNYLLVLCTFSLCETFKILWLLKLTEWVLMLAPPPAPSNIDTSLFWLHEALGILHVLDPDCHMFWSCLETIHTPQSPTLCSVLGLISYQRTPKGQVFLFSVLVQTGLSVCPSLANRWKKGVRFLPSQTLPLARWFLQQGWSLWVCFHCP